MFSVVLSRWAEVKEFVIDCRVSCHRLLVPAHDLVTCLIRFLPSVCCSDGGYPGISEQ